MPFSENLISREVYFVMLLRDLEVKNPVQAFAMARSRKKFGSSYQDMKNSNKLSKLFKKTINLQMPNNFVMIHCPFIDFLNDVRL